MTSCSSIDFLLLRGTNIHIMRCLNFMPMFSHIKRLEYVSLRIQWHLRSIRRMKGVVKLLEKIIIYNNFIDYAKSNISANYVFLIINKKNQGKI